MMKKLMPCFLSLMLFLTLFMASNENLNAACNHKWGTWKTVKAPTCTKDGRRQRICSKCRATSTSAISKTGHNWTTTITRKATCQKEGRKVRTCKRCCTVESNIIPMTGHKWSLWVVRVQPTYTSKGIKKRSCTTCHAGEEAVMPKKTK